MISKSIIDAVIRQAKLGDKDRMLSAFIFKLNDGYLGNDNKINHCLELLLGEVTPVGPDNLNMDYIKEHFDKYVYKADEYIIKDIELNVIDNIEGIIHINYKCKAKINEYRDDIDFHDYDICISFIDNPEVLKNS